MKIKIIFILVVFLFALPLIACQNNQGLDFNKGKGTEQDPYLLETFADLYKLTSDKEYYYALANDLFNTDDTEINISLGDFYGHLDGKGFTIHDVIINNPSGRSEEQKLLFCGLFGILKENATIKNLNLEQVKVDIDFNYRSYIGTIVGYMEEDSEIQFVNVKGRMTLNIDNGSIGGVVGKGRKIYQASSDVYIGVSGMKMGLMIGGIVGYNLESVIGCQAYGDINYIGNIDEESSNLYVAAGGIAGFSMGNIMYSANYTDIYVAEYDQELSLKAILGGIVGESMGYINYTISSGSIYLETNDIYYIGGLAGILHLQGSVLRSLALTQVDNSNCQSEEYFMGGVVGYTLESKNARMIYYSQEVNDRAIGNYEDSALIAIENHSLNYYLSGIELENIGDMFIYEEGKLPRLDLQVLPF